MAASSVNGSVVVTHDQLCVIGLLKIEKHIGYVFFFCFSVFLCFSVFFCFFCVCVFFFFLNVFFCFFFFRCLHEKTICDLTRADLTHCLVSVKVCRVNPVIAGMAGDGHPQCDGQETPQKH